MKIIHALEAPNTVLYAGDGITLTENGATSQSGSFDASTTTANAALVDGVELPNPWIGGAYGYTDDAFVLLNQGLLDAAFPPAPAPRRRVTRLAFRSRFTQAEKVALEIASLDNPAASMPARTQAAGLRVAMKDQENATYIDLDRADTRAGTIMLETAGLLAAGRALEILDAPIEAHEAYQGA